MFSSLVLVCQSKIRNHTLKVLRHKIVEEQTTKFSKKETLILVLDNFGSLVSLNQMCGSRLSKRLPGTHKKAH